MIRVVRPTDRYFVPGTLQLNAVSKYHLKSYLLQYVGILDGVNTWSHLPLVQEHPDLQYQKKAAWLKAHGVGSMKVMEADVMVEDVGMDLEEEVVVETDLDEMEAGACAVERQESGGLSSEWSSLSVTISGESGDGSKSEREVVIRERAPVYVDGRATEPYDQNLDFDVTE